MEHTPSLNKIGAPGFNRAPIRIVLPIGVNSEDQFQSKLCDARITRLAGSKCSKGTVVVKLIERADLVSAVYGPRADAFGREVGMIQNIKIFSSDLEFQALREVEVF